MVFDPRETWARLYDYDPDGRQVGIALCAEHADAVSVPAGWEIVDDRSPVPHLAPVAAPAADEPPDPTGTGETSTDDTGSTGTGTGSTGTGSPTLWSVDELAPDPGEPFDEPSDEGDEGDADPDAIHEDDPLGDRDPGDDLDVDESTPLLSRAFRAAHVD